MNSLCEVVTSWRDTKKTKKKQTINKATNQATNMTANRTANLAANMATNVTAKVTAHKATSMVQGIGQGCIRVRTWLHASHHCGKLELSLTSDKTITYHEKGLFQWEADPTREMCSTMSPARRTPMR